MNGPARCSAYFLIIRAQRFNVQAYNSDLLMKAFFSIFSHTPHPASRVCNSTHLYNESNVGTDVMHVVSLHDVETWLTVWSKYLYVPKVPSSTSDSACTDHRIHQTIRRIGT